MADHVPGDTGEDPNVNLAPIRRGPGRPPNPVTPPPQDPANMLATAFAQALSGVMQPAAIPIRMPEDKTEVVVIANRVLHVDPAHLAYSQIAGAAAGQDGASKEYQPGDKIIMRPCTGLDWLLDHGYVRPEHRA